MSVIIIESTQEFEAFKSQLNEKTVIFPLFETSVHPFCSKPIVMVAKNLETNEIFVLPSTHSECLPFFSNFDFLSGVNCVILDKKYVNAPNSLDLESIIYSSGTEIELNTRTVSQDWGIRPIYQIVDLIDRDFTKIGEICRNFTKNEAFNFLNTITVPVLAGLEKNGLKVDREKFITHFEKEELVCKDDYVFTQYNYLTSTGRPSNRFGGVNFSALKKAYNSRDCFVSRFLGGNLFLMDYDSYHPRLISKLVDVELPPGSIHEYFGRLYFNKLDLTPEEYEESKKITFRLVYGNITDEYKGIEYFKKIDEFINSLWDFHQDNGFIKSVISKIKITADSKTKLFNYLIQNFETECNMLVLQDILKIEAKSKPILYTYDSILFDIHPDEGLDYVRKVRDIMSNDGFGVKIYQGNNYNDMKIFNL